MNEVISIYMLSYNHERFIRKAIESIVNQEVNVSFKLYIHDDASTDKTKNIILQYEKKYPDIIVPIIEDKNVYSQQGYLGIARIISNYIRGEYVCCCEGDDYWIDKLKLQIQYNYMKTHKECTYCFSNAFMVNTTGKKIGKFFHSHYWKDRNIICKLKRDSEFSTIDIIKIGFTPTASVMMTKEAYIETIKYPFQLDLESRLVATEAGYAHYINKPLTAYRLGNPNSASGRASASFEQYKKDFCGLHKEIYDYFNSVTNNKYHSILQNAKDRELVLAYIRFLSKKNYREFINLHAYDQLRFKRKLRYFIKCIVKG